jgi:protein Mpv17
MVLDSFLWSPFVCCLFPTCIGTMEGKSLQQVEQKINTVSRAVTSCADRQFAFTTWTRAQCVFAPTQIINYTFVPAHLRLLLLQGAGFCEYCYFASNHFSFYLTADGSGWNIYLSWSNESSNRYFEDGLHSPID